MVSRAYRHSLSLISESIWNLTCHRRNPQVCCLSNRPQPYSLKSSALFTKVTSFATGGLVETQRLPKQALRGWGPRYSSPMSSVAVKKKLELGPSSATGYRPSSCCFDSVGTVRFSHTVPSRTALKEGMGR